MNHEVKLIDYLPLFVQEYDEIRKIMTAENPEFQYLWEWNEKIRNDLFIVTAGEIGVERYERMLKIVTLPGETLDFRKARILLRVNDQLPYTMRALRDMLTAVAGEGNFEIQLDANAYSLKVRLEIFSKSIADSVFDLLQRIVPANLVCTVSNDTVQIVKLYFSGAMTQMTTHKLSVSVKI
jgi:hypothetical protein